MFVPNNLFALSVAALVASGFPRSMGRTLRKKYYVKVTGEIL